MAGSTPSDDDCPLFKKFLSEVMAGDTNLIAYIQRFFGYCLTGVTTEHMLAFGHGLGRNGKGVLVGVMMGILGSYHKTAPMETFLETYGAERHPTDLAMLRGRRLVTATETDEGRRWAESKIKALTGGDPISARFMRQDFFEYMPKFKLFLTGNHKPSLKTVDEAIRARLNLIPFAVTIPADKRDKNLGEKLRAEYPGILRWAIEGCLSWQKIGLAPPPAVVEATDAYLASEDAISQWMDDRCLVHKTFWASSGELFKSWKGWAELAGERPGSAIRFGQALEGLNCKPEKVAGKRGYWGLKLKKPPEEKKSMDSEEMDALDASAHMGRIGNFSESDCDAKDSRHVDQLGKKVLYVL
jgi:putative DNA primase/helicase